MGEDKKGYKELEKKMNSFMIPCTLVGALIGYAIEQNWIILFVGAVIGMIIGRMLFSFTADDKTKKEHAEYCKTMHAKKQAEKQRATKSLPKINCPTCNSSSVEKITAGKKLAYVAATGVLAPAFKKVRSQFECKSCGHKW